MALAHTNLQILPLSTEMKHNQSQLHRRPRICFVVAVPGTALSFLRDHIQQLSHHYDVYLAVGHCDPAAIAPLAIKGYKMCGINRNISPLDDIRAIYQLSRYFSKMHFDAVHSVTPKAGMITAIAAKIARIPHRIHIFTGQVWAGRKGPMRALLKSIDKIIASLDNHILVDGASQRQYLIDNKVLRPGAARVLAHGSICGVNTSRFNPDPQTAAAVRAEMGITPERTVFAFMGRLNRDKGLFELLTAFNTLAETDHNAFLLLIGNDEENITATFDNYHNICLGYNFLFFGPTSNPGRTLQAADIFVIPTYREGFGSSVIEASCLALPVITSDTYGVLDAAIDGVTGLRCKVADVPSLLHAMTRLAADPHLRHTLGANGRQRILSDFTAQVVTNAWLDYYRGILPGEH